MQNIFHPAFNCFVEYPKVGLLDHIIILFLWFWETHIVFHSDTSFCILKLNSVQISSFFTSSPTCHFLSLSVSICVCLCVCVISHYTFLMISNDKPSFHMLHGCLYIFYSIPLHILKLVFIVAEFSSLFLTLTLYHRYMISVDIFSYSVGCFFTCWLSSLMCRGFQVCLFFLFLSVCLM